MILFKNSTNLLLVILCSNFSFAQENYFLTINNSKHSIQLDDTLNIQNGEETISIILSLKDTLEYISENYSIRYPKEFGISEAQLEEGIEQIMIMSSDGNGIMIQDYKIMNPSMLQEFMLSELTKESIAYGYTSRRSDYKRILATGQEIDVLKCNLTYQNEVSEYEVASIGKKDEGLLIITISQDVQESSKSHPIVDVMWNSLKYK